LTKRPSTYSHLQRLCLWLGALFIPLTIITGLHQYDLIFHPFDLNRLSQDEVLPFEHRTGRQLYSVKLNSLANRPRPDILITGNHVMRNFQGTDLPDDLDFFNFVINDPSIIEEMDLFKALERIDRLPSKLMIYTIVAHGGRSRLLSRKQSVFTGGNVEPPFNLQFDSLGSELQRFFGYQTYLDALVSLFGEGENIVMNYKDCARAYAASKKGNMNSWLTLRLKISEYFPEYISLNSGLLSKGEYCRNNRNFEALSTTALARNGGHLTPRITEMTYNPENIPILTPEEYKAGAKDAASAMRRLERFAGENGFRMVYLIPQRYDKPLNNEHDEVQNLVFESNPDFTVIDFRRLSLETIYYVDDSHLSEKLGEILNPCLVKILNSKTPLPSRPAVNSRGRTMC